MENFQTLLKEEIKVAFSDVFSYDCPLENISIDDAISIIEKKNKS